MNIPIPVFEWVNVTIDGFWLAWGLLGFIYWLLMLYQLNEQRKYVKELEAKLKIKDRKKKK